MKISEALVKLRDDIKLWCTNNFKTKLDKNIGAYNANKLLGVDEKGDIVTVKVEPEKHTFTVTKNNPSIDVSEIIDFSKLYYVRLYHISKYRSNMFSYDSDGNLGAADPTKSVTLQVLGTTIMLDAYVLQENEKFGVQRVNICSNDTYSIYYDYRDGKIYIEGLDYSYIEDRNFLPAPETWNEYTLDIIRLT